MWRLVYRWPLTANTVSSGLLMAVGDIVQQRIEVRQELIPKMDWKRTGRMLSMGLLLGPPHHWFYLYLDKWLPKTDVRTVTKKILYDQFVASPFCIVVFFGGMGLMEGKAPKECNKEIAEKFIPVYIADWCIWPPAQFVNFYYLPSHYRVLYVNAVTMIYNIFLSYMKHKESHFIEKSD